MLRDVCGLQAQVLDAAALGLRVRSVGLRKTDIERSLTAERSIVRTWLMRGTLHLVAADDLRWLLALLGPVFAGRMKSRHTQLGLDDDLKARGVRAIRRILGDHGALTRHELVERLARLRIRLNPRSQAPIHLIAVAALDGICCLGPDRGTGESTYVLLDDWVKAARGPTHPLAELARRYVSAYGPASLEDLAAWSGLPMGQARSALAAAMPGLERVSLRGAALFVPRGRQLKRTARSSRGANVRLLPAFDTYLLGYRNRDLAVDPSLQKRLQRGGGWLHPAVVDNGRAVGAWSIQRKAAETQLLVEPFRPVTNRVRAGLEKAARDLSRFIGRPLAVRVSYRPR